MSIQTEFKIPKRNTSDILDWLHYEVHTRPSMIFTCEITFKCFIEYLRELKPHLDYKEGDDLKPTAEIVAVTSLWGTVNEILGKIKDYNKLTIFDFRYFMGSRAHFLECLERYRKESLISKIKGVQEARKNND